MALREIGVTKTAKGLSEWPISPSELPPLGADAFVQSMLYWLVDMQDTVVLNDNWHLPIQSTP
ncbi:hypothetical protein Hypma_001385 [Hypsizygus marmoreus]|uniref:Uncharacterized protein n=1 Tax=Hypsizygus marmoreus TaxID=39966 RepID=A0A369K6L9_HYPMA|nr:hypothetical protein Hypma_001385 [Hypsizygus marmoreus]